MPLEIRFSRKQMMLHLFGALVAALAGVGLIIWAGSFLDSNGVGPAAIRGAIIGGIIGAVVAMIGALMTIRESQAVSIRIDDEGINLGVAGLPAYTWGQIHLADVEQKTFGKHFAVYVDKPGPKFARIKGSLMGIMCRPKGEHIRIAIPVARLDQDADTIRQAIRAAHGKA